MHVFTLRAYVISLKEAHRQQDTCVDTYTMRRAACARALDPTHTTLSRALALNQTLHPVVVPDMLRCDFPWSACWSMHVSVCSYMSQYQTPGREPISATMVALNTASCIFPLHREQKTLTADQWCFPQSAPS